MGSVTTLTTEYGRSDTLPSEMGSFHFFPLETPAHLCTPSHPVTSLMSLLDRQCEEVPGPPGERRDLMEPG